MKFTSTSCKGISHRCNEDAFAKKNNIAIIADGMGGEHAGEVASNLAVDTLLANLDEFNFSNCEESEICNFLTSAVAKCDYLIQSHSVEHPETIGMGTTIVVAIIVGRFLYVCWCGDSRCFVYNFKTNRIPFSTYDHSYVQELIDQKKISVEESFSHPDNNIITRYIGGGTEYAIPQTAVHQLSDDDIIVLCSDGLTGFCSEKDIVQTIRQAGDSPKELCDSLRSKAISKGGTDDITILVSNKYRHSNWRNLIPFNFFSQI